MQVLVADDDRVSRCMLAAALERWGMTSVQTANGVEALHVLEAGDRPVLALLDWTMPGMSGLEVCRRVRSIDAEPYVYIIMITGHDCPQSMVRALESGADDFIAKPFDPAELRARLGTAQRILTLHRQLIAAREASAYQARYDGLTKVLNRSAILEFLRQRLRRAHRDGTPVAVALADLDHFKRINDEWGHHAGDAVLCETTARMTASLRGGDRVGRYGGEEFLLVLPGIGDAATAAGIVERVRAGIVSKQIDTGTGSLRVTCSFGIAVHRASATTAADDPDDLIAALLRRADEALYRAKSGGRDRIEVATEEPTVDVRR